jgi:hypothetical protein
LVAAGFGVAAVKSFGEAMFNASIQSQKLNASLISVTGSQKMATESMKMLKSFASETPFALNQVTDAFIKMKALGLDASAESLRSFGNTASAMGKDLNQMIEAVADASTGEFERLKTFGIKSRSEGDNVSFTFQGVTTTVKKSAEEITGYLKSIGDEKFGGAMAEQMKTLGGAVSNFGDSWDAFLVSLGESGPADAAAESLNILSESLRNFGGALDLFQAYREGKVGLWDWISANPEDAKRLLEEASTIDGTLVDLKTTYDELRSAKSGNFWWSARDEQELQAAGEALDLHIEKKRLAQTAGTLSRAGDGEEGEVVEQKVDTGFTDQQTLAILEAQAINDVWLTADMERAEADMRATTTRLEMRQWESDESVRIAQEQAEINTTAAQMEAQAKIGIAQDVGAILSLAGEKSKGLAIAGLLVTQGAAIAATIVSTHAAAAAIIAPPPIGLGPLGGASLVPLIEAQGAARVALIAATTIASGAKTLGGGGSGNITAKGTPGQPVSQPQAAQAPTSTAGLEIRTGGFLGTWLEQEFAPAWNDARSRGVDLVIT